MKKYVKTYTEFAEDVPKEIPQEGDKKKKKKGNNLYLDTDAQNKTSQDQKDPLLARYPQGGI